MFERLSDPIIREASLGDVPAIAHLWFLLSLNHESYHPYYAVRDGGEQTLYPHIKDLLQRNCLILVAEVDGVVCGFVSGYMVSRNPQLQVERVGKVDNIFVDEKLRGKGIGTKLLDALISYFKNRGVQYFEISCDLQNPDALRLYKKLGFVEQKVLLVKSELPS